MVLEMKENEESWIVAVLVSMKRLYMMVSPSICRYRIGLAFVHRVSIPRSSIDIANSNVENNRYSVVFSLDYVVLRPEKQRKRSNFK